MESALERKVALYDALHAAGGVGEEADDYNDPRYMVDFLRKGDKGEGPRRRRRHLASGMFCLYLNWMSMR